MPEIGLKEGVVLAIGGKALEVAEKDAVGGIKGAAIGCGIVGAAMRKRHAMSPSI